MRIRIIIKFSLCVLVPLLTFVLGSYCGWLTCENFAKKSGVYVYNTQQKLDAYYKNEEKAIFDLRLPSELTRDAIEKLKRMRPLVVAGQIVVFFDDIDGSYEVCEEGFHKPFVMLDRSNERFDRLYLNNKVEKDWKFPRFSGTFSYSKDNIYEKGALVIYEKDGKPVRAYRDTMGVGAFDEMQVYENDITIVYHLNGLSWEKVTERQHHPLLLNYENVLSISEEQPGCSGENEKVETE